MASKGRKRDVSAKEGKLLAAVKEVAEEGYDPSAHAIALIVKGEEAVERFQYLRTYGCLVSPSVKKIKTLVSGLLKKGYLNAYAPPPGLEQYMLLTPKGEEEARLTLSKKIRRTPKAPSAPLFQERN